MFEDARVFITVEHAVGLVRSVAEGLHSLGARSLMRRLAAFCASRALIYLDVEILGLNDLLLVCLSRGRIVRKVGV